MEEEIPIELLQKGICITDEEAHAHATLILEEIEGSLLAQEKLMINAKGLKGSLRLAEDGIVFFGTDQKTSEGEYINDYILNVDQDTLMNLKSPHLLMIYYQRDLQKYYLRTIDENKETFFIFILLETPHLIVGDNIIFSVLNYNFKISSNELNSNELIVEYGQGEQLTKVVLSKDKKLAYQIGRKSECDIVINDVGFSREQTLIFYDETASGWFIKDGGKESHSMSGTWLYVDKTYHIQKPFKFKIGPSRMKIEIIPPNKK